MFEVKLSASMPQMHLYTAASYLELACSMLVMRCLSRAIKLVSNAVKQFIITTRVIDLALQEFFRATVEKAWRLAKWGRSELLINIFGANRGASSIRPRKVAVADHEQPPADRIAMRRWPYLT